MSSSPFIQSIHDFMCVRRYSRRTVDSYLHWIRAYIRFHRMRHPTEMGASEVEQFLTFLAVNRRVAAATQAVALNALVFLYSSFLNRPLKDIGDFKRSSRQAKLPVVLTVDEVGRLLGQVSVDHKLMVSLLYGSGLRRIELVRLRVKDIDLDNLQVRVWNGKGAKHRIATLAPELLPMIERQMAKVKYLRDQDKLVSAYAGVWMPDALAKKYRSAADIRTLQQQLGHADVKTTEIYTHVLKQGAHGVRSPLSQLLRAQ